MGSTPYKLPSFGSAYRRGGILPVGVINQINRLLSNVTGKDGINVQRDKMNSGLIISGKALRDKQFRFKLSFVNGDTPAVRVREGAWTRMGTRWALATDADVSYKSITQSGDPAADAWLANTTYYIYVKLEVTVSSTDPTLFADKISVYATTALPTDTDELAGNRYVVLGTATTAADTATFTSVEQWWYGGDIDDIAYVPDAASPYDDAAVGDYKTAGLYKYFSVDYVSRAGKWSRNLQVFEWDSPTEVAIDTGDHLMFRDVSDNNKHLRYLTIDDLSDYVVTNGTPTGGGSSIGDWLNDNNYIHHTDLDFTDTGSGWAALGTGKSGGSTDHDDSYPHFYNDGSGINSQTFVNTKSIYTSATMAAADFIVQDRVANNWGNAEFNVDVTTSIGMGTAGNASINADGTGSFSTADGMTVESTGAALVLNGQTGITATATTGNLALTATVGNLALTIGNALTVNGDAGVSGNGFDLGIKTSEASADAHIMEIVEMYL